MKGDFEAILSALSSQYTMAALPECWFFGGREKARLTLPSGGLGFKGLYLKGLVRWFQLNAQPLA
jgi:hypothetical protein